MSETISPALMAVIHREFALDITGIHGLRHWERVCANGLHLAASTGADVVVVELFAFLHDVKRQADGADRWHGRRAAEFIRTIRGTLLTCSQPQTELLLYACEYHSAGLLQAGVTVQTCWDADRLDLGRVGVEPAPSHLCTPAARDADTIRWAFLRSLER